MAEEDFNSPFGYSKLSEYFLWFPKNSISEHQKNNHDMLSHPAKMPKYLTRGAARLYAGTAQGEGPGALAIRLFYKR